MSCIRGLCTKNDINRKLWANFDECNGLWPFWEPRRLRSRFIGIWKVRISPFCIIFKLKRVFSALLLTTHPSNNLHSITYHENSVQSPIKTCPIIALHEHWEIFHRLELYINNQIPFCQIRLRSITCHFLVNNLHLITYSNRIFQPTEKIHMLQIVNFPRNSPQFWLFLRIKLAFSFLELNPVAC